MTRCVRWALAATLLLCASSLLASAPPGIELVGIGYISGDAIDKSGLAGSICQAGAPANCVPKSVLGGFGSALAYTGHDNVFVAAPDRGPFDGLTDVPYLDRFHFFHITTDPQTKQISTVLLDTRFLRNEFGQTFVGGAGAFDPDNPQRTLRLDPEGVRIGANGNFYVSDEYGPYVFEFDRQGNLVQRIEIPSKFQIANQSADPNVELLTNTSGRQANRGMEGLAISQDGFTLVGVMQNALLQDGALNPGTPDRIGLNNRILAIDLTSGDTHEYVYRIEASNRGQGVSEILAVNDHQFLVVEREIGRGCPPSRKRRPANGSTRSTSTARPRCLTGPCRQPRFPPASFRSRVALHRFARLGLRVENRDARAIAEEIEGLAWGPDLPDGRHVLYVLSDNDLVPANPTQIYALAIDDAELTSPLGLEPQFLPGPLYPPGQVKKALGR